MRDTERDTKRDTERDTERETQRERHRERGKGYIHHCTMLTFGLLNWQDGVSSFVRFES